MLLLEGENSGQNASQTHVIKQLAVLRKQLSTEEQKVQKDLEKNVVGIIGFVGQD